jgi:hypothetical protein
MHIHGNQFDPNIQLNALDAAAKAEAKQQAEETRKKLISAASALAGGADCVVELSGDGAPEEQADGEDRRNQGDAKKQAEQADSLSAEEAFSDWA